MACTSSDNGTLLSTTTRTCIRWRISFECRAPNRKSTTGSPLSISRGGDFACTANPIESCFPTIQSITLTVAGDCNLTERTSGVFRFASRIEATEVFAHEAWQNPRTVRRFPLPVHHAWGRDHWSVFFYG